LNVVGIVAALAVEARVLGPTIKKRAAPASLIDGSLLEVSGMGCAAAAIAARTLIDAGATALASWGMAGGLDPALRAGTIFLPSEVVSAPGAALTTAIDWRRRIAAAIAASHPVTQGKLLTSAHPIGAIAGKSAAFRDTGALAVDMESFAIAEVAAAHALPFIAIRVIVDAATDALPPAVMVASRSGQLRLWRLIWALACAPAELAGLIRLARRYEVARRSLRAVARAGPLRTFAFPSVSPAAP
jgi:adenosylhomocysteine nucleosidase